MRSGGAVCARQDEDRRGGGAERRGRVRSDMVGWWWPLHGVTAMNAHERSDGNGREGRC